MKGSIRYYISILKEKMEYIEKTGDPGVLGELVEECDCLVEISDNLLRTKGACHDEVRDLSLHKKKLREYKRRRVTKKDYNRLMELRPLLGYAGMENRDTKSESTLLELHKKLALEEIRDKVDEIADLNTYIHSVVNIQGENLDNVAQQIENDSLIGKNTVDQLESALCHRQGRNRFYNIIFVSAFILIILILTVRVILRP